MVSSGPAVARVGGIAGSSLPSDDLTFEDAAPTRWTQLVPPMRPSAMVGVCGDDPVRVPNQGARERPPVVVQLALNVTDLESAVELYVDLFGVEPPKQRPGYANFSIAEPALELVPIEQSRRHPFPGCPRPSTSRWVRYCDDGSSTPSSHRTRSPKRFASSAWPLPGRPSALAPRRRVAAAQEPHLRRRHQRRPRGHLRAVLLTDDRKLASAPTVGVRVLRLPISP